MSEKVEHPASEQALAELVRHAAEKNLKLRVMGAGHSPPQAIFGDPESSGDVVKVKLDRYAGLVLDPTEGIVLAQAGIHLGADPSDPLASEKASLLYQLWEKGWTLADLGGIAHQTVSGFTATASAGGSIKYSFEDCIYGFRVIDAGGSVTQYTREDPHFWAMVPNMGLLGVVSAVLFKCVKALRHRRQRVVHLARPLPGRRPRSRRARRKTVAGDLPDRDRLCAAGMVAATGRGAGRGVAGDTRPA